MVLGRGNGLTGFLASVASLDEAILAVELGADIIDLKDPASGALGAWPLEALREASRRCGEAVLSATVGDLPMQPELLADAAAAVAETGVTFVKIGFFAGGDHAACTTSLAGLAHRGVRLVAVMMADQAPDFALLPKLAAAGFAGVMLDTADKKAGGLRAHQGDAALRGFLGAVKAAGLLAGLAGSLGLADIPALLALRPDYLGFRGALCGGDRAKALDPAAFAAVRAAVRCSLPPASLQQSAGDRVRRASFNGQDPVQLLRQAGVPPQAVPRCSPAALARFGRR